MSSSRTVSPTIATISTLSLLKSISVLHGGATVGGSKKKYRSPGLLKRTLELLTHNRQGGKNKSLVTINPPTRTMRDFHQSHWGTAEVSAAGTTMGIGGTTDGAGAGAMATIGTATGLGGSGGGGARLTTGTTTDLSGESGGDGGEVFGDVMTATCGGSFRRRFMISPAHGEGGRSTRIPILSITVSHVTGRSHVSDLGPLFCIRPCCSSCCE